MEKLSLEEKMRLERQAKIQNAYVKLGWIKEKENCPHCHQDGQLMSPPDHQTFYFCLGCYRIIIR